VNQIQYHYALALLEKASRINFGRRTFAGLRMSSRENSFVRFRLRQHSRCQISRTRKPLLRHVPRSAKESVTGSPLARRSGWGGELRFRPVLTRELVIGDHGHAQRFLLGEERRRITRPVEHQGETVE
jgi:hypothetical protein